jgi:glycosyltransferase involved in cell wall biosynthesis
MKILRIIARLNVGGPARHVVWLTKKLQNEEFQSLLIAGKVPDGEEDMSYFAVENGVEPIYIAELSRELSPKDIVSLYKIYREIKRQKPDIIHTHTAKAGTIGRVAAFVYKWFHAGTLVGRPRDVKIVHTFHGHVFHSYYGKGKTQIFLLIEKMLARFATNRIVVITEQQYDEIHEKYGVGSRCQFSVIPLGIDLATFAGAADNRDFLRREIGAADNEIVVGFTGRLTEIKNIPLLLEVAARYKTLAEPLKLRFIIIGDGNLRQQLEQKASELELGEIVTFLGNRQDVANLLPGFDVIALTSKNEGTPLSLIEAMAAGIPLISTAVGGVVDLGGKTVDRMDGFWICERGVVIDDFESEHFLNGLLYLAKNEKLRERLKEEGIEFINSNYSVDRLTKDIVSLYREIGPKQ